MARHWLSFITILTLANTAGAESRCGREFYPYNFRAAVIKKNFEGQSNRQTEYLKLKKLHSLVNYFRGTIKVYYYDMLTNPEFSKVLNVFGNDRSSDKPILGYLHGDDHMGNRIAHLERTQKDGPFGEKKKNVLYVKEDFDDSFIGNWQLDLVRLSTNVALIAQEAGLSPNERRELIQLGIDSFLTNLEDFRDVKNQEGRQSAIESLKISLKNSDGPLKKFLRKVYEKTDSESALDLWTTNDPKLGQIFKEASFEDEKHMLKRITPKSPEFQNLQQGFKDYRLRNRINGKVLDWSRRIGAGVGAIQNDRYYLLVHSNGENILLEVKEQKPFSAFEYVSSDVRKAYTSIYGPNQGLRVSEAKESLSDHNDPFLGWMQIRQSDGSLKYFSVMEINPFKKKLSRSLFRVEDELVMEDAIDQDSKKTDKALHKLSRLFPYWTKMSLETLVMGDSKNFLKDQGLPAIEDQIHENLKGRKQEFTELLTNLVMQYSATMYQDYLNFWREQPPK